MSLSRHSEFPLSPVAARLQRIEDSFEYQKIDDIETFPTYQVPIFIRLGHNALADHFALINPNEELSSLERRTLNPAFDMLLIHPETYNAEQQTGYRPIHPGQSIRFGRDHDSNFTHFESFSRNTSRNHGYISRSEDGKRIAIGDTQSLNGVFTALAPETEPTIRFTTSEYPDLSARRIEHAEVQSVVSASLASEQHPQRNEDAFLVDNTHATYGVFDGLGGHEGGEIASRIARDVMYTQAHQEPYFYSLKNIGEYLVDTFKTINMRILKTTAEAATTAAVAKVSQFDEKTYVSVAHSGDSRAYLLRDTSLYSLTVDHSAYRHIKGIEYAKQQQKILANTDTMQVLSTEQQIAFNDRRTVGSYLGRNNEVPVDIAHYEVQKGDIVLLSSDGVHDNLTDREILNTLRANLDVNKATHLTYLARHRAKDSEHLRAKKDDMTAVVVEI